MNSSLKIILATSFFFLLVGSYVTAQETGSAERGDFVSDASFVVGTYQPSSRDHSADAKVAAAQKFLAALSDDQRKIAGLDLKDPERRQWTNLPARPNAGGVRLGDLDDTQVKLVCDLMATLLSEQGYNKMRDIMLADDQLLRGKKARPGFGTEEFSVVLFGEPAADGNWAFQIDGHHVGVNVSINGDESTIAPSFIGTQPEKFTIGNQSYEPFAGETGNAYELINSLDDEQLKLAILLPKRGKIVTGPGNDGHVPTAEGVDCSSLDDSQKPKLLKLIKNWVDDLPEADAKKRMQQIESEIDQMKFSWNGNKQPGSDISYTIQSPSLIIEYACQDLGGNPLAHLHSVYRDPTNEYAKQLDE